MRERRNPRDTPDCNRILKIKRRIVSRIVINIGARCCEERELRSRFREFHYLVLLVTVTVIMMYKCEGKKKKQQDFAYAYPLRFRIRQTMYA